MQVDPIKPKLKPPETQLWKVKWDILLSTSAFKFNSRRYIEALEDATLYEAGSALCHVVALDIPYACHGIQCLESEVLP